MQHYGSLEHSLCWNCVKAAAANVAERWRQDTIWSQSDGNDEYDYDYPISYYAIEPDFYDFLPDNYMKELSISLWLNLALTCDYTYDKRVDTQR